MYPRVIVFLWNGLGFKTKFIVYLSCSFDLTVTDQGRSQPGNEV